MKPVRKKTLIIVDVQNGFINELSKPVLLKVNQLLKDVHFDKVFATKFINKENSIYKLKLKYDHMCKSEDVALAFEIPKNLKVIEKTSYGISSKDLKKIIKDIINDDVYLCGLDYDSCVNAIAFQLFDNRVDFRVVEDSIGSFSARSQIKEDAIKVYKRNFGEDCFINSNKI